MKPVHPGEILREDIFPELHVSKVAFAKLLGLSRQSLYDLLEGRNAMSTIVALRLERLLGLARKACVGHRRAGQSAEMWLTLQRDFDLAAVREERADELGEIEALKAA